MGLDFSPASLEYSIHQAAEETLACEYAHADLLTADFGTGFDLVTMVNGELNTFIPETVASLFTRSRAALKDGGAVVLETTTDKTIRAMTAPPSWYTSERGLFSDDPHLILIENFRDEAQLMNTTRWFVTDTATGEVTRYTSATREYPPERLATMLQKSGFADIEHVPSLRGTPDPDQPAVFVTRARASS